MCVCFNRLSIFIEPDFELLANLDGVRRPQPGRVLALGAVALELAFDVILLFLRDKTALEEIVSQLVVSENGTIVVEQEPDFLRGSFNSPILGRGGRQAYIIDEHVEGHDSKRDPGHPSNGRVFIPDGDKHETGIDYKDYDYRNEE